MNTLDQVLISNKNLLGDHFENLGRRIGFHKKMLSFDDKHGWRVRNLSIFQLFLRAVLGRYKSTHLSHVAKAFNAVSGQITHPLSKRIDAIWQKKYPKKHIPKYWSAFGNTDVSNAQIFCLTEFHNQTLHKQANGHFINTHFRPGDVLLVEGIPCTSIISSLESPQLMFVSPAQKAQGWEPADFNDYHKRLTGCYGVFMKKLDDAVIKMLHAKTKDIPCALDEFLNCYKESARKIDFSRVPIINSIMRNLSIRKTTRLLQKALITAQASENYEAFHEMALQKLVGMCSRLQETFYDCLSKEALELVYSQTKTRNDSLINEMEKYINQNRRVFITTGASHALKIDNTSMSSPKKVQQAFKKYRYLILMDDSIVQKQKIAQLNQLEFLRYSF